MLAIVQNDLETPFGYTISHHGKRSLFLPAFATQSAALFIFTNNSGPGYNRSDEVIMLISSLNSPSKIIWLHPKSHMNKIKNAIIIFDTNNFIFFQKL